MKTAASTLRSGFSLVELVIVVAIMGVIAAIAIPRFADASSGRGLQATERIILDDIENAKLNARASSTQHIIMFDTNNDRYVIAKGDEVTRDTIIFVRELNQDPYNIRIKRTNRSATGTAIITPFGDLSPAVTIEIIDGSIIRTIELPGIADTGTTPVVDVSEDDVDDINIVGGLLDALGL